MSSVTALHRSEDAQAVSKEASGDVIVSLKNVALRYGGSEGVLALEDTSFEIRDGEFMALVGPSGCGKSTIVKLVSGLLQPSEGQVIVDGEEVRRPLSIAGIAFQNPVMLPWLRVIDNVLLPLKIVRPHRSRFRKHRKEYLERALELLSIVGLEGFERKYPWQLSGGMRQRASLCRALIHEPRILLFDEPFAALDAFTREELWQVLQDLWLRRKPTIILITHDLREATYLADKVYLMSARPGRIVYSRDVPFARPRALKVSYQEDFGQIVHDLRLRIEEVRQDSMESKL